MKKRRKTQHPQHHFVVFNIYVAVNIKQFFFVESRCYFFLYMSYFLRNLQRFDATIDVFALLLSCSQCTTFFYYCSRCAIADAAVALVAVIFRYCFCCLFFAPRFPTYRWQIQNCWLSVLSRILKIHKQEVSCNS